MYQEGFEKESIYALLSAALFVGASATTIPISLYNFPDIFYVSPFILLFLAFVSFNYWIRKDKMIDSNSKNDILNSEHIDNHRNIAIAEYEQICEEIRYRERYRIYSSYFSLGIQAVLANLLISVDSLFRPVVCSIGLILAFSFGIGTISIHISLERLLERQRLFESQIIEEGLLGIYHTIRTKSEPSLMDTLQLASRVPEVHAFFVCLWFIMYILLIFLSIFT